MLGGPDKQLIIEQTGPREWAYWVVALGPRFRVIFKSGNYDVGHELGAEDLDGDGTRELIMDVETFWFFDGLCGACSPRFPIGFRYDRERGGYFLASRLLERFCDSAEKLNQAEQEIKLWKSANVDFVSDPIKASDLYSKVLWHSLPLIYCGKESLGWSFFDRLYNLPDREVRKARIKRTLRRDRIYRAIRDEIQRDRSDAALHRARVSD